MYSGRAIRIMHGGRLWTKRTPFTLKSISVAKRTASRNWACSPIIHMVSIESIIVTPHPLNLEIIIQLNSPRENKCIRLYMSEFRPLTGRSSSCGNPSFKYPDSACTYASLTSILRRSQMEAFKANGGEATGNWGSNGREKYGL